MRKIYNGLSGGKVIYKKLIENNVDNVWISTGGAIMPLIDAFHNGSIKYYLSSHEQFAGHIATSYARTSGKTGVSIVTSGPGFTNSLTALTDANNDSIPFILLSGQVSLNAIGTNAFQECPSVEMSKPVTKWSYCVDNVNDLPDVIDDAFKIANNGRKGAVHIDLPKCITSGKFTDDNRKYEKQYIINNKNKLYNDDINKISELINNASKPILLIGKGCNDYSDELRQLAIRGNIPVTTTIHAMGCFDETHNLSLEFLGMHGNAAANYAIQESDLIIALGTRFDDRITGNISKFAPKCKGNIIHVNIDDKTINKVVNSKYNYNMDCGLFIKQILNKIKRNNRREWFTFINRLKNRYPFSYVETDKLKTQQVIEGINNYLLNNNIKDYYITTGVGNHQMMASQFIKWRYPNRFISSGSLGTMGVGLPFAIGCQIANPYHLVIDIDGDGSFNHSLNELKSISNYNLPIKIAIMNDSTLSMVKVWEKLFYNENYTATDLGKNPDYVKLANSFEIKGITCSSKDKLSETIDYFLSCRGPMLCDFRVESDLCLPLVAPGAALDNMILNNKNININNNLPPC